jgi:hypothetical protein
MISYQQLNAQNHELIELSNVLTYLLRDRSMCDTGACCELFYRFMEKLKAHMELVDSNLYGALLTHSDHGVANTARNFMSGGRDIKHIIDDYKKRWCARGKDELAVGKDYDRFVRDTEELFGLVTARIQTETERLYPLVREVTGNTTHAAA